MNQLDVSLNTHLGFITEINLLFLLLGLAFSNRSMLGRIPLSTSGSDYWKEKGLLMQAFHIPQLLGKATEDNSMKISEMGVLCLRERAEHKPGLVLLLLLLLFYIKD